MTGETLDYLHGTQCIIHRDAQSVFVLNSCDLTVDNGHTKKC